MALAVLALPASAASAATLTIANGAATYEAAAEANRVQVSYDGATATMSLTDLASSLLAAPEGCTRTATATDATVTCPAAGLGTVVIRTGDGADSVAASATAPPPFGLQVALGPGDDRLDVLAGVAIAVRGEGGNGRDLLNGGDGADLLTGGAGDDTLVGGLNADTLQGGAGQDTVSYRERTGSVQVSIGSATPDDGEAGEGDDVASDVEIVLGGSGDDRLVGSRLADRLDGGNGSDVLRGLAGNDELSGDDPAATAPAVPGQPGPGDDVLEGGPGADRLHGGGGVDTASYAERVNPVRVDLGASPAVGGEARENDQLDDVENVWGGLGRDTLLGDGRANLLWGGPGRDVVAGRGGADVLVGGPGRDTARGDGGDDLIAARDGAVDVLQCGGGQDRVAVDNGPPGPSDGAGAADRDGIDDPFEIPVIDAVTADCETRDVLAGGGVGGAPAGSPLNPKAVVDVALPYAVVTVLRAVVASDGSVLLPLTCSARAAARCAGTVVLRASGATVGQAQVVVPAGRDGTFPVPLDAATRTRVAGGPVRVVATLTVHDALGREAVSRFAVTLRAA